MRLPYMKSYFWLAAAASGLLLTACGSGSTSSTTPSTPNGNFGNCGLPSQVVLESPAPGSQFVSTAQGTIYIASSAPLPSTYGVDLEGNGNNLVVGGTVQPISNPPPGSPAPPFANASYYSASIPALSPNVTYSVFVINTDTAQNCSPPGNTLGASFST
ncbi:MAG: hypothetical protein NVSMB5_23820 [Candidatus Velthaea sp.]